MAPNYTHTHTHARLARCGIDSESDIADPGPRTFAEIGHDIFLWVILLFPMVQEGLLSVTRESVLTS